MIKIHARIHRHLQFYHTCLCIILHELILKRVWMSVELKVSLWIEQTLAFPARDPFCTSDTCVAGLVLNPTTPPPPSTEEFSIFCRLTGAGYWVRNSAECVWPYWRSAMDAGCVWEFAFQMYSRSVFFSSTKCYRLAILNLLRSSCVIRWVFNVKGTDYATGTSSCEERLPWCHHAIMIIVCFYYMCMLKLVRGLFWMISIKKFDTFFLSKLWVEGSKEIETQLPFKILKRKLINKREGRRQNTQPPLPNHLNSCAKFYEQVHFLPDSTAKFFVEARTSL